MSQETLLDHSFKLCLTLTTCLYYSFVEYAAAVLTAVQLEIPVVLARLVKKLLPPTNLQARAKPLSRHLACRLYLVLQ